MKVLILYRQDSETHRAVDEFVHEFQRRHPEHELTLMDADSIEGSQKAEVYDVVQYPTVLAISNDGSTLQRWDNGMMPLMSELAYYANQ